MTRARGFWSAAVALAVLDAVITTEVLSFIDYASDWRCGTGVLWASTKATFFSVLSLPVAFYVVRSYFSLRGAMSPGLRFAARGPLICFAALLLAFFVVFRVF